MLDLREINLLKLTLRMTRSTLDSLNLASGRPKDVKQVLSTNVFCFGLFMTFKRDPSRDVNSVLK